jgi:hypothetical protein
MQPLQSDHAKDSSLRFVFDDTVVSFDLPVNATFEDIGRVLEKLARRHHRHPIAIDVTLDWRGRRGRAEIATGGRLAAAGMRKED